MFADDIDSAYHDLMAGVGREKKVETVTVDFSTLEEIDPLNPYIVEKARLARRSELASSSCGGKNVTSPMEFAAQLGITVEDVQTSDSNHDGVLLKSKSWKAYYGDTEDVLFRKMIKNMVKTEDDVEFIKNEIFISDEVRDECNKQQIVKRMKDKR